jgi:arginyl-tRNA synthetase
MAGIRETLERYRVHFDNWFLEATLYEGEPSAWDRAREKLAAEHRSYRSEGALWLRTTALGDDKDRVLERSTGEPTYLASDVAYHWDKLDRGYDRLVNVLGADHHGYVARLKAAVAAVGGDPDRLEVPLLQFVHVVEGGERASMSKRRGDFVTLQDLIDEIGVDATRYFMLSRSADSTVDIDLTLAKEESGENPVYYVQYAHARIASLLRKAGEERVAAALTAPRDGLVLEPAERDLVKKLLSFPGEVADAAERRAPHRMASYALETAQAFTAFYRDCRVVGAEPEALESFRLALSVATQRVIARSLAVLGVGAPASMERAAE